MSNDSTKTDLGIYWGALAKLPQIDAIFRACKDLEEANQPINRESVKNRSGVTFTNLLATGIKLYRGQRDLSQNFTHTPAVLLQLVGKSLENAFGSMQTEFSKNIESVEERYSALVEGAAKDLDEIQHCLNERDHQILEKKDELKKLFEDKAGLIDRLSEAEIAFKRLDAKYSLGLNELREATNHLNDEKNRSKAQSDDHRLALNALAQEHGANVKALNVQHDNAYAHVMTQWGNEREQWKTERRRLDKRLTDNKEELADRQGIIDKNVEQLIKLNQHLQAKQGLEEKLEIALQVQKKMSDKLVSLEKVEEENITYQVKIVQLDSELSTKTAMFDQFSSVEQLQLIQDQLLELKNQFSKEESKQHSE